jgi:hypothetical protein
MRHAYEHGDAERPALRGNGEQRLDAGDVTDADVQAVVPLIDLGDPIGLDGLLDP